MTGQLIFEPTRPKAGTVKAAVLNLLRAYPDGLCRRDFANHDIYEVANRIGELQRDGWIIVNRPCKRHAHKHRLVEYYLA